MSASFTMPLKEVLQSQQDTGNGLRIGLDDYPIFDEAYRNELNRKIIRHYWNREIAHDTVSLFTYALMRQMHEIMPLYNQVYKTTLIEFNPLSTVDLLTERSDTTKETNTGNTSGTAKVTSAGTSEVITSDTPQTMLADNEDYASGGTESSSDSSSDTENTAQSNSETDGKLDGNSHTSGYQGSPADLIIKARQAMLNVDMLVINDLEDCFFGLWGNGHKQNRGGLAIGTGYGMMGLGYFGW